MDIQLNRNGPLRYADLYKINEATFWDKTRPPNIDADPTDEPYKITSEDRIDLLAFRKYGIAEYGWIILLRNNLRLYPNDLIPGITIYIPAISSLKARGII